MRKLSVLSYTAKVSELTAMRMSDAISEYEYQANLLKLVNDFISEFRPWWRRIF